MVTVTVNVHCCELPYASVAVYTMVVEEPVGKKEPLGKFGAEIVGAMPELSVAVGCCQVTVVPVAPVAAETLLSMLAGQKVNTGGILSTGRKKTRKKTDDKL